MNNETQKLTLFVPFDLMPESESWGIGNTYRAKVVLKQISTVENGALFELIDASSLEPGDSSKRRYITDGGYMKI